MGDSDITTALAPYISNIPKTQTNNTNAYAYDSYLYHSSSADAANGFPVPGAWIIWVKQSGPFTAGECPGATRGPYPIEGENLYHCYQYLGPN